MDPIEIRPYDAGDRAAVRRICFVTGYMGEPVWWQWRDEESFADLFTGYYTDHEPQSAFVAVRDGRVVGYLLGCRDTASAGNPGRALGRHLVRRGIAFRPGTGHVIWRGMGDIITDALHRQLPTASIVDSRWPSHLHIDLLHEARGQGVGGRLIRAWLEVLRGEGIAGCHLETFAENTPAVTFFESMGFERRGGPLSAPGLRTREGSRMHAQLMVMQLH